MRIKHAIEKPEGAVMIQAEFGPAEVAFLMEYALNSLYERGALPFLTEESTDVNLIHTPPNLEQ